MNTNVPTGGKWLVSPLATVSFLLLSIAACIGICTLYIRTTYKANSAPIVNNQNQLNEQRYLLASAGVSNTSSSDQKPYLFRIDTKTGKVMKYSSTYIPVISSSDGSTINYEVDGWSPIPDTLGESVERLEQLKRQGIFFGSAEEYLRFKFSSNTK